MAITKLSVPELRTKLGIKFTKSEDVLGPLFLAKNAENDSLKFQIRIRETSPAPSTEIMLPEGASSNDLDELLKRMTISRRELFWIHPRVGGTLRRHVVDMLISNLDESEPLVQILVGPRQVGKTTAVKHLINEWSAGFHYATADSVVDDFEPWLQRQWQKALLMGEGTLLVLDEIQKVENWREHIKALWDKTKNRGIKVVILGSTSLNHCLTDQKKESFAGRFFPIYVPHWSFPETKEAFGSTVDEFSLFGGYPKAMEYLSEQSKWFDYVGKSIINPIINVDIYQQGKFTNIDNLRRAFKVFCQHAFTEINYTSLLKEIQQSGNTDIVKKYLGGYYDSFLMSPVHLIDDNGNVDTRKQPNLMMNCSAVYTFGTNKIEGFSDDPVLFRQSIAGELKRIPNKSFGYWQKSEDVGMDLFIRTTDNNVFGVVIEGAKSKWSATKSYDSFRKTFKNGRIVTINPDNYSSFLEGQRAFLEVSAI